MSAACQPPDHMATPLLKRLALAAASVAVTFAICEVGLRLSSPALPSLAALEGVDMRDLGDFRRWTEPRVRYDDQCEMLDPSALKRLPQRVMRVPLEGWSEGQTTISKGSMEPLPAELPRLWVAGDSVAQGWGVEPTQTYAFGLAGRWAELQQQDVVLRHLGAPGMSYCGWLGEVHRTLDTSAPRPDQVVLQVFADDLEERGVILVRGQLVADPDHAEPAPLRPLLWHSYLANRLWFAQVGRHGSQTPERQGEAARFLSALQGVTERLDGEAVPWTVALVAPAGIERCAESTDAWSDCTWLSQDLERMAAWMDEVGQPYVDLRPVALLKAMDTLPDEEIAWVERGRLPVHPGKRGHALIARYLSKALGWETPPPSPEPQ